MKKFILLLLMIPIWGFSQNDKTVKDDQPVSETSAKTERSTETVKALNPIYVVDGKITDKDIVERIDVNEIDSIQVWKGENAVEKYGEKGKDGAIEIYLKKKKEEISVFEKLENGIPNLGIKQNKITGKQFPGTSCQISVKTEKEPIYVLNGIYIQGEEIENLDPNNIESVQILKTENTVLFCRNPNPVIVITTKDSNYIKEEYKLIITDLGYESFLAMQPSAGTFSISYLQNKNKQYVSIWNNRVLTGNPEIYESSIDYDSRTYYGLDFEYKLFMFFKFIEHKYSISLV